MPLVTGRLSDLTSLSLAHKEPELIFTLNAANTSGGGLYPSYPTVITPDATGYFQANLAATEDMVDAGWYTLQIRMLGPSSDARTIVDFPNWRVSVPRGGGIISKLIANRGTNPSLVWQSTEPPLMPHVGMKWLDTNTGRLYAFRAGSWNAATANSDWVLVQDLTGPSGYNALGTEPQQQTIADWLLGTAGGNPLKDAFDEAVTKASVNSETFMPTANITYKYDAAKNSRYEVIRVRCNGRFRPGILHKEYAKDFHLTSPGGDNFKAGPDVAEAPQVFAAKHGADILFNASGWDTLDRPTKYMLRGLQIKDGVMYRDFELTQRGMHALGVRSDGTMAGYKVEEGWTGASVLADGVVETFGFGPLLVHNGIAQDIESLNGTNGKVDFTSLVSASAKSGRQILGHTATGDILLISTVGVSADNVGIGGNDISALAASEGCYNAIMLDGGGSVQTIYDGYTTHPSSDSAALRTAGDMGTIFARCTQAPDSSRTQGIEPLKLDTTVTGPNLGVYMPGAVVRSGTVSLSGSLVPAGGGNWPANTWIIVGSVPDKARPKKDVGSGSFLTVPLGSVSGTAKLQIRAYGQMSINLSASAPSVDLDGATYAAF
ncbi:phosphodiester glycosidase family protein [Glutamicibacter sp. NPDC087344]|uniref:phosphodiester glycosidase family protein n=1 Tax=Glutamicibacter sp. NPDC087344 TaxID=3363994 RepID=UPI003826A007